MTEEDDNKANCQISERHHFLSLPNALDLAPLPLNSTHTHTAASIAILSEFAASFEVFMLSR
jgi:hypothetical protein